MIDECICTNPGSKWTFSWFTYGATYVQPASAARTAWLIVKSVVANVCTPANSRVRQAINPSQVAGILIQMRDCSNPGCRYWNNCTIPTIISVLASLPECKHTQSIYNRLLCRVGVIRVGLDMDMAGDMRGNLQCQLDHLPSVSNMKLLYPPRKITYRNLNSQTEDRHTLKPG